MNTYRDTALSAAPDEIAEARTGGMNITGFNIINPNTTDVYVKFYNNTQGNVTVGTTTPVETLLVPANGSIVEYHSADRVIANFTVAATVACVTGLADSSTTAPTTPIYVLFQYS